MKKILVLFSLIMIFNLQNIMAEGEITVESMSPVVVKTSPQAGQISVDSSLTEISITFSKDMLTENMWSWVMITKETFPVASGDIHYLDDKRTCVMPVKLEPGKTYAIWINTNKNNAFRDVSNHPAVPYLLTFSTLTPTK